MTEQQTAVETPSQTAVAVIANLEKISGVLSEFDKVEAGLAVLRDKYAGVVFEVATTKGMADAVAARRDIRDPRYSVEDARKKGKAPVLAVGKSIDQRAAYITEELLKLEEPIHAQIKAEETRKEQEREARAAADRERIMKIQSFIAEIKDFANGAVDLKSLDIATRMDQLEQYPIDELFGEFKDVAMDAKVHTMDKLNGMHKAAGEREAEALRVAAEKERIRVERVELERQKAEQAERERVERDRMEASRIQQEGIERAAREKIEREEREARNRIEAEKQAAQERMAEEERQARLQREEQDRIALEQRQREEAEATRVREEAEAKMRAEADRLQREREAKEKAKRDKDEAAQRARLLAEQERMDARQMLHTWLIRFGHIPEYKSVAVAIEALPADVVNAQELD